MYSDNHSNLREGLFKKTLRKYEIWSSFTNIPDLLGRIDPSMPHRRPKGTHENNVENFNFHNNLELML